VRSGPGPDTSAGTSEQALTWPVYERRRQRLLEAYAAIPAGEPVRLAKRTSNLFRTRQRAVRPGLPVGDLDGVLAVDPQARTADVQGMTTYEHLVAATLPYGLMPLVVPQLRTITLGGAVTGLGIESSSFRNGLPHESVLEAEILTGDGRCVLARPDNEHRELFAGFPNSYGTLGYALRLRIELEPVQPYVHLRHVRFSDPAEYFAAVAAVSDTAEHDGGHVDFVDGTLFGPDEMYLTLATFVDGLPAGSRPSDYTGMDIYYRSIQSKVEDHLTVEDYLWRWDTDWFWCSRALGVQHPAVRRVVPKRWLRSDVYWRIVDLEKRYGLMRRLDRLRGRPQREDVVQDVEVPVERGAEFWQFFAREVGITPVWACPLRLRPGSPRWPLYPLRRDATYVNFGFWSSVALRPGERDGTYNRLIEAKVAELGGRKTLYSTSYYDPAEFWAMHDGPAYRALRKTYDPDGRLLDLYDKTVRRR